MKSLPSSDWSKKRSAARCGARELRLGFLTLGIPLLFK